MRYLKQSTSVDLPIGPFLDATDGVTPETALTITQPDIRLKKGGAAWAQKAAAQTLTHEENGYYEVTLDATDTNTLGPLRLAVHESGAAPVWEDFMVLPAMIYDSLVAGSDRLDVNLTHVTDVAAGKLASHIPAVLQALTTAGGTTTAIVLNATTGIDGAAPSAVNDFYNGRVFIFTSGALAGQATSITDYVGATQTLTVVALTAAPASGVTGVIV